MIYGRPFVPFSVRVYHMVDYIITKEQLTKINILVLRARKRNMDAQIFSHQGEIYITNISSPRRIILNATLV